MPDPDPDAGAEAAACGALATVQLAGGLDGDGGFKRGEGAAWGAATGSELASAWGFAAGEWAQAKSAPDKIKADAPRLSNAWVTVLQVT